MKKKNNFSYSLFGIAEQLFARCMENASLEQKRQRLSVQHRRT